MAGIVELLSSQQLNISERRLATEALREVPWCWPPEAASSALAAARSLAGDPPPLPVGQVPFLTVSATKAAIWRLVGPNDPESDARDVGGKALRALSDAEQALPSSLPLLWSNLHQASLRGSRLCTVAKLVRPDVRAEGVDTLVDGASLGLSFVLAMASRIFKKPIRDGVAASAEVDASGKVKPVDGIREKISVLKAWAPRITVLLVAREQEQETENWARPIQVVRVDRAHEGLHVAFDGTTAIARWLVAQGQDPESRAELVREFFRLCVGGREPLPDWKPVLLALETALEKWSAELSEEQHQYLVFCRAVAARYADQARPLPDPAWTNALPAELRERVLAHYIQHASEVNEPAPEQVLALTSPYLARGHAAHGCHLEMLGATARLLALTGRPEEALEMQREAAEGCFERLNYRAVTFPLSEWYRLAGDLNDAASWQQAEEMRSRVERMGGLGPGGNVFVELYRHRAALRLAPAEPGHHLKAMEEIAAGKMGAPLHVQWAAVRALRWTDPALATRQAQRLVSDDQDGTRVEAFLALMDLDRALAEGNKPAAHRMLGKLERYVRFRSRTQHLTAAAARLGAPVLEYLARFFPY